MRLVLEAANQRFELAQCFIGAIVRKLRCVAAIDLEFDRPRFARRRVAAEANVKQFADGRTGSDALEAALAQNRGFQRQLRRQSHAHLLAGRRNAGLVVEQREGAVGPMLDAVGARRQREGAAVVEVNCCLAANFRVDPRDLAAAFALPAGKPSGDAQETRPPQRARLGSLHQGREVLRADIAQSGFDIVGQRVGKFSSEIAERGMDRRAAIRCRQRHVHRIERDEFQDALGEDRVGITQPVLDLGHRHLQRPQSARRLRRGLCDRLDGIGAVERFGVVQISRADFFRLAPCVRTGGGFKPMQEA